MGDNPVKYKRSKPQGEEDIHLHTAIFAMDLMTKVLERGRAESQLEPGPRDKLYNKIQFLWQNKLRSVGQLPIPRPAPVEGVVIPKVAGQVEDIRLTTPFPPLKRPPGRLSGKPAPFMAPIPYHSSSKVAKPVSVYGALSNNTGRAISAIREDFVLVKPSDGGAAESKRILKRPADEASSSSSASSFVPELDAADKVESEDHSMPLTEQRKKRRVGYTIPLTQEDYDQADEDLILGMKMIIDPRYFQEYNDKLKPDDNDAVFTEGRIVQIYPVGRITATMLENNLPRKCKIKLREPSSGREVFVNWPNRYVSIYQPVDINMTQTYDITNNVMEYPSIGTKNVDTAKSIQEVEDALADIFGPGDSGLGILGGFGDVPQFATLQNSTLDFLNTGIGSSNSFSFLPSMTQTTDVTVDARFGASSYGFNSGMTGSSYLFNNDDDSDEEDFINGLEAEVKGLISNNITNDIPSTGTTVPFPTASAPNIGLDTIISPSLSRVRIPKELVRLVNGEYVTEATVNDVETYFEHYQKIKKFNLITKGDDSAVGNSETPVLLPDEDPSVPLVEPDVVLIGRLRKVMDST